MLISLIGWPGMGRVGTHWGTQHGFQCRNRCVKENRELLTSAYPSEEITAPPCHAHSCWELLKTKLLKRKILLGYTAQDPAVKEQSIKAVSAPGLFDTTSPQPDTVFASFHITCSGQLDLIPNIKEWRCPQDDFNSILLLKAEFTPSSRLYHVETEEPPRKKPGPFLCLAISPWSKPLWTENSTV